MVSANNIGRVGVLAVALGIGVGLGATPWVAAAKPASNDSTTGSSSTDGGPGPSCP
jgi:hypothetical protein